MTDLRQAAQQALEALGSGNPYHQQLAAKVLRTALEQQAEPVPHAVIVGALFDFMGWLTTRKERLVLSSTDNASPAVESITEFAKMRGLSLADARVQDWQNYTTQQHAEPVSMPMPRVGDRVICLEDESLGTVVSLTAGGSPDIKFDDGTHGTYLLREFAELFGYFTPPQRPWVSLTDEEINANRTLRYHFSLNNGPVTRAGIAVVETIEAMLKAKNHG